MGHADLTLHEAAEVLGVHYMTAYRYVRLGLLNASKSGGTWRVAPADLEAFRTGAAREIGRRDAPWAARLQSRLMAGDASGAWSVVEAALAAGAEVDEIYLDVLSPAMTAIGDGWQRGEVDVAVEHRASGIAMRIIGRLGPRFTRRGRARGSVVVGSPAGERHSLPVAILADLVRGGGWEVSDLGADVPNDSFVMAAATTAGLDAVGISVTNPQCLDSAASLGAALRRALPDVLLVVGGAAVQSAEHARSLGDVQYAADGRSFLALLDDARVRSSAI
jgi:MerR family transcriptional regulator, light-induced transcriptional regulator